MFKETQRLLKELEKTYTHSMSISPDKVSRNNIHSPHNFIFPRHNSFAPLAGFSEIITSLLYGLSFIQLDW